MRCVALSETFHQLEVVLLLLQNSLLTLLLVPPSQQMQLILKLNININLPASVYSQREIVERAKRGWENCARGQKLRLKDEIRVISEISLGGTWK